MNAESIVVSLDMAKLLSAEGWPQKDVFEWYYQGIGEDRIRTTPDIGQLQTSEFHLSCSAPTAEEIIVKLPSYIEFPDTKVWSPRGRESERNKDEDFWLTIRRDESIYHKMVVTYSNEKLDAPFWFFDVSLANAAAEMWCYLSENNLL